MVDTLRLKIGETLLIRGGTSSVGLASIQIAKQLGATVVATTRKEEKAALLKQYGADIVIMDDNTLCEQSNANIPNGVDKVLELIGTTTLQSSFKLLKSSGILCMTGILGGEWKLEHFAPMDFIPSGSYFTVYDSQHVKDVAFATVDEHGKPQARIIDVMIVQDERLYFVTSRGKEFYKQLSGNPHVAITGMTKDYLAVRLNGSAKRVGQNWLNQVFKENPSMSEVYLVGKSEITYIYEYLLYSFLSC